jgi:hypothetical protein
LARKQPKTRVSSRLRPKREAILQIAKKLSLEEYWRS